MGKQTIVQDIPKELVDALQEGRVVALVCAGMSARAGIPTWDGLLELMYTKLKERDPTTTKSFAEARANGDSLNAGDIFKNSTKVDWFEKADFFREIFLTKRYPTPEHLDLLRLGLAGIITTNYDHLLEDAYARVEGRSIHVLFPSDLERSQAWQLRDFYIVKLHGDALDWESLVLGRSDYSEDGSEFVKQLLANRTLLVLGYGGYDPRVNNLIESLRSTCPIYMIQGQTTYNHFVEMMNAWDAHWRKRLSGIHLINYPDAGGKHRYVVYFIEALRRLIKYPTNEVKDCEWGAMPPEIVRMDYPNAEQRLMEFLNSGDRCCLLRGSPGAGVSSFAARWSRNLAAEKWNQVMRIECKEWLSLDIYILFLLACTGSIGRGVYSKIRSENTGGWDRKSEASAVARAIDSSEADVVLVVEHPERLENEGIEFLDSVLSNSRHLRILFISRGPVASLRRITGGREVRMGRPSDDSLRRLIQHYAPAHNAQAEKILSDFPSINAGAACLTGGLVQEGVLEVEAIDLKNKFKLLFKYLKQMADQGSPIETIAKACAIVRTPRSVALVEALCGDNERPTSEALDKLSMLGILMKDDASSDEVRYAMSTSVREKLLKHYFFDQRRENGNCRNWTRSDSEQSWQSLNFLAGQFFEQKLNKCGGESLEDVAPLLCMSLYHYQEAKDWNAYIALVVRWRKTMLYHWHFPLLEKLLQIIPEDFLRQNPSRKVDVEYTLARIARVRSLLSDYRAHLQEADEAFRSLGSKQRGAKRSAQLKFEAGILWSMERDYKEAVGSFRKARNAASRAEEFETEGKAVARLAQASMSRGLYRSASHYLESLGKMLDHTPIEHEKAVLERHKATLSALRAQAMERAGFPKSDIEAELNAGHRAATECYKISKEKLPPSNRPDESGMGIAELKMAQLEWYARKYEVALVHIPEAIGLLSGYPNSRWWRMCCHDVAARCHALLHHPQKARKNLQMAWEIFQDSCKTDIVRECELRRTEGLIAIEGGSVEEAIKWLESSLDFADKHGKYVPPILYSHLLDLSRAYLIAGVLKSVHRIVERANNVSLIL
jgi:tetratricopeptide (TPR) repeat protein/NAD-dependent SIR2 family protein deacetylase